AAETPFPNEIPGVDPQRDDVRAVGWHVDAIGSERRLGVCCDSEIVPPDKMPIAATQRQHRSGARCEDEPSVVPYWRSGELSRHRKLPGRAAVSRPQSLQRFVFDNEPESLAGG